MDVQDAVIVVTGAAGGIGAALVRRFAAEGARRIVAADLDGDGARRLAADVGEVVQAAALDVTDAGAMTTFVQGVLDRDGAIDLFCSNAGVLTGVGLDDPMDMWHRAFDVNVMAHVHAARAVLPSMVERGHGWLVNTASAAGLLTAPGDAVYTVTKHGAVAFAEWLSVTYGGRGIGVSVICPFGVATPMLLDPLAAGERGAQVVAASGEVLAPEQVADAVVTGLAQERFLILPHPEVGRFWAQKASDPDRWLAGVRRLIDNT